MRILIVLSLLLCGMPNFKLPSKSSDRLVVCMTIASTQSRRDTIRRAAPVRLNWRLNMSLIILGVINAAGGRVLSAVESCTSHVAPSWDRHKSQLFQPHVHTRQHAFEPNFLLEISTCANPS